MDNAKHIVAIGYGVHDDAEGAQVENTVYIELLGIHFAVNAVDMLNAAVDRCVHPIFFEAALYLSLNIVHECFEGRHALLKGLHYLVVSRGVKVHECQVLKLPLGLLHTQAVRNGSVDLHRLKRLYALFFLGLICHGAHIVQTVGDLDEDNADILRHRHQHLAQVFHLLVFLAGVLHARELRDTLDDVRDRFSELAGDIVVRKLRVLYDIMQERRDDGVLVKTHVHRDIRRRHAMRHIR